MNRKNIRTVIKLELERRNMSQRKLAQLCKGDTESRQNLISKFLLGKRNVGSDKLLEIADALGMQWKLIHTSKAEQYAQIKEKL